MSIPSITFQDNHPVVFIPSGTKLSKRFRTTADQTVDVKKLLSGGDANTKLRKSNETSDVKTFGLSMAPHGLGSFKGRRFNNCIDASPVCIASCINESGLASVFQSIALARFVKSLVWNLEPTWFLERLDREIDNKVKNANGSKVAIRLNVFSDIDYENHGIIDNHPNCQFYDYTKRPGRVGDVRPNYWVTFSRSETNHLKAIRMPRRGHNVAVVFASRDGRPSMVLPKTWKGYPVYDGDKSDMRFDDPRGHIIGLTLKTASTKEYQRAIKTGFPVLVD